MSHINLRESLNSISEVIINRPRPLREFDQIYMRAGDMLLQVDHVSRLFNNKNIVFIGDGDSIGLCLVHLHKQNILDSGPAHIHVLDFDERIVLSIQHFASKYGLEDKITSELYNVAFPVPKKCWQSFDGFYTNPPYGSTNGGNSVNAFLCRGIECVKDGVANVVIGDDDELPWTQTVIHGAQNFMSESNFYVTELIPKFHTYHLDDHPTLKSCSISFRRNIFTPEKYNSRRIEKQKINNFYGENIPLTVDHVKDLTNGGKMVSRDHELIKIKFSKNGK